MLTAHLLAGALAGTGPLLVAGLRCVPSLRQDDQGVLRRVAVASLLAMIVGVVLGFLSGGILWGAADEAYRKAVLRFPPQTYTLLAAEWCFTLVLYGIYLTWWTRLAKRPLLHGAIALVAATNLLYHFPTFMTVLGAVAGDPSLASEAEITRPVFRRLLLTPDLFWKVTHFWSLSVLVAGVAVLWSATCSRHRTVAKAEAPRRDASCESAAVIAGGVAGLVGVMLLMVSGMATLVQLPALQQRALLGGDVNATVAFVAGVMMAIGLGKLLLSAATGEASPRLVRWTVTLTVVAVAYMAWAAQQAQSPFE
ncbi:MAG: hypothetical protein AAGF31_09225 [Planctomycetota bacterium]